MLVVNIILSHGKKYYMKDLSSSALKSILSLLTLPDENPWVSANFGVRFSFPVINAGIILDF